MIVSPPYASAEPLLALTIAARISGATPAELSLRSSIGGFDVVLMTSDSTVGVDTDGARQGRLLPMPSRRRRPKSPINTTPASRPTTTGAPAPTGASRQTDVERFAAALKDSEKADRAAKARQQQERADAAFRAEQAAAKAVALTTARRELERAVEAVRMAKQAGRGRAEADQAWKVAKALVIELETGIPPSWAPKPPDPPEVDESSESVTVNDGSDEGDDGPSEEPVDAE